MNYIKSFTFILFVSNVLLIKSQTDESIVTTQYGKLQGVLTGEGREFLKVPYAQAPIGDLRWTPPQLPQKWNGTRDATQQMPGCYQSPCGPWFLCPQVRSEDCLYMNIYTPFTNQSNPNQKLPVFMFIHGGSFIHYYGGAYVGNSTTLTNLTNTIAVLINYRLGSFGYYYNERLNVSGNFGYHDQKAALRWVRENIEAFGGDPNRIVIGGESAGAQSVTLMTVDSSNDGLYAAAIVESNPVAVPYRTPATWHEMPETYIAAAECNIFNNDPVQELQCLKSRSSEKLLTAQNIAAADGAAYYNASLHNVEPWPPTINGIDGLFPDQPQWLYRDGKFNKNIPMIMGTNRDEFSLFLYEIWNYNRTLPAWELYEFMGALIGVDNTDKAFVYYNVSVVANHSEDMRGVGSQMLTDATFRCPSRYMMRMYDKYNDEANSYFYHFNHPASFNQYAFDSCPMCWTEVCHAAELPFVFRIPLAIVNANASYTPDEWNLSEIFQFYWSSMGKIGTPGHGTIDNQNGVDWLPFIGNGAQTNTILLDVPPPTGQGLRVIDGFDNAPCNFWDSLGYNWNFK